MATIQLEELEMRLLLAGAGPAACSSLSPLPPANSGPSSLARAEGGIAPLAHSGGGGPAPSPLPVQNSPFAGPAANGNLVLEGLGGLQRELNLPSFPGPPAPMPNLGAVQLANALLERGVNVLPTGQLPPLIVNSTPPPEVGISLLAGIVYNTNWFSLSSVPFLPGNSASPDLVGPRWAPLPNQLAPSLPGMEPIVPHSDLRDRASQAAPLGPLPFAPQNQPALPLALPPLSSSDQQSLPVPAVALSALETSLLEFLADLGQTTSPLEIFRDVVPLRMWIFAAAGAGAACFIAYREQRRTARLCAAEVPQLPGCSLLYDE